MIHNHNICQTFFPGTLPTGLSIRNSVSYMCNRGFLEAYISYSNHYFSHSDSSSTTRSDSSTRRRKKSKHKKKKHKKLHKHSEKRADLTPPTNITEPPLYHLSDSDCDDVQLVGRPKGLDKPHRKSKKRKHAPDTEDDKSKKPKKHKKHKKHKHKNLD